MNANTISTIEKFGTSGLRKSISTNPNYSSAILLNNLVKSYNICSNVNKISNGVKNFSLATPIENNNLILNYGLKNISPNNSKYLENILVLGRGIFQKSSFNEISANSENLLNYTLYDLYDGTEKLNDCYILGCVYLSFDNNNPEIIFSIARPLNENDYLILFKDCELKEIENILKYDKSLSYPIDKTDYVLLFKFIVDIESFQNERKLDRYFFHIYDVRNPEGLFGITEEQMFSNMIVNILNGCNRIESVLNVELINVIKIVQQWVELTSWEPSFEGYWSMSEKPIPSELKIFLEYYLGINL